MIIIIEKFNSQNNIDELSPIVWAYIGDAVYELFVRSVLVGRPERKIDKIHKEATDYVCSKAQSDSFRRIQGSLTPKEMEIWRRGRNAKTTAPKNSDVVEYHVATGLEALIGYIYLKNDHQRLFEIMNLILCAN